MCSNKQLYVDHALNNRQLSFARCEDIDECREHSHDCSPSANCTNNIGSYNCSCRAGFRGNGKQCEDIDECREDLADCDVNAVCVNRQPGYDCVCKEGYKMEEQGNAVTGKCLGKVYDHVTKALLLIRQISISMHTEQYQL